MNERKPPLTVKQKVDVEELTAILRGARPTADLLCRVSVNAYIAGMKQQAALDAKQTTVRAGT